jgi:hypothetical protein
VGNPHIFIELLLMQVDSRPKPNFCGYGCIFITYAKSINKHERLQNSIAGDYSHKHYQHAMLIVKQAASLFN